MMPHPKLRKTIKWGGAVVTVLLVVVWVVSGWYWARWHGQSDCIVDLGNGTLGIGVVTLAHEMPGLTWFPQAEAPSWEWTFYHYKVNGSVYLSLPIWILTLVTGIATYGVWRLDTLAHRRAKLNLCPTCHYDRTGLTQGAKCPECGNAPT